MAGLAMVSMVEVYDKSCFSFHNVILDSKLNADLRMYNDGMEHYTANQLDEAIKCFSSIVDVIPPFTTHVYGYSYYHLITIYRGRGDAEAARFWFNRLRSPPLPDREYFINALICEGYWE
jgi:tetratricopeptide (TPR) repeat protein